VISTGGTFIQTVRGTDRQNTRPTLQPVQDRVQSALNLSPGSGHRCGLRDVGERVLMDTLFAAATLANALIIAELARAF